LQISAGVHGFSRRRSVLAAQASAIEGLERASSVASKRPTVKAVNNNRLVVPIARSCLHLRITMRAIPAPRYKTPPGRGAFLVRRQENYDAYIAFDQRDCSWRGSPFGYSDFGQVVSRKGPVSVSGQSVCGGRKTSYAWKRGWCPPEG
jgi:hypothetical protein